MKQGRSVIFSIILILIILAAAIGCLYFIGKTVNTRSTRNDAEGLEGSLLTEDGSADIPDTAAAALPADTNANEQESSSAPAETPEPALTPTPEPLPLLGDPEEIPAGTLVYEEEIDREHLDQYFRSYEISDAVFERIYGDDRSYKTWCTVPREHLRYIKVLHRGFDGSIYVGELIVNYLLADDITAIFRELFLNDYPIERMLLIDEFGADDDLSIANNNTSAFNFRPVTSGTSPSNHAYGCAIDINPKNNPYVEYDAAGNPVWYDVDVELYLDRDAEDAHKRHMIDHDDLCFQLFTQYGWNWGGDWTNPVDYQHFEKPIYP